MWNSSAYFRCGLNDGIHFSGLGDDGERTFYELSGFCSSVTSLMFKSIIYVSQRKIDIMMQTT